MKIAVITGASSGMGREAAYQLANTFPGIEELWLIARRKERLLALQGAFPARIRCFGLDVTKEEDRKLLLEALETKKPQVKFLVNAAGVGRMGKLEEMLVEDQLSMIRLNCEALCAVTALVLPYMDENSRILQFASAAAFLPQPGFSVYAATKSFVLSYSRSLNQELRPRRIWVTAVCPGPVDTEFFDTALNGCSLPAYKKLFLAKPRKVVRQALRDAVAKKELSVYGFSMKLFYLGSRLLPHSLFFKGMEALGTQRSQDKGDDHVS